MKEGRDRRARISLLRAWEFSEDPDVARDLAIVCFRRDRVDEALKWARLAASLAPDRADFLLLLGDLLRNNGNLEEAGRTWQKALLLDADGGARRRLTALHGQD
jgi:Flp pilus assembly protein TadD